MFKVEVNENIPEVRPDDLNSNKQGVRLIDVRRPDEFNGELGHIEGAELITLGPDLANFLEDGDPQQKIVFICRSGARSGQATLMAREKGYKDTYNMKGGMLLWNSMGLPVVKDSH